MTIPALYEVRLGTNDSDWGTTMPHTVKLMGVTGCRFTPKVDTELIQDMRGRVWPGVETQVTKISGEAELTGWASYDDIPYLFDAYFGTVASAAASDEFSRTYVQSSDWADTDAQPKIFTIGFIETGSDANGYALPGATLSSLRLSGRTNAPVTYTANFFGKQIEADTADALIDRDVEFIMGGHTVNLYIDSASATVGATEITNSFFTWDLNLANGSAPLWRLGNLTPATYKHGKVSGTLKLGLELTTTTAAYVTALFAATNRAVEKTVRIKYTDTTNTDVSMQIDFAGVCLEQPTFFTDEDGVTTLELTLTGFYGEILAGMCAAVVVNTVTALA